MIERLGGREEGKTYGRNKTFHTILNLPADAEMSRAELERNLSRDEEQEGQNRKR